jgi:hypothetical protein
VAGAQVRDLVERSGAFSHFWLVSHSELRRSSQFQVSRAAASF